MRVRSLVLSVLLFGLAIPWAYAGPPFLTDDPEPVPFKNAESYVFTQVDRASDGTGLAGPLRVQRRSGAEPAVARHSAVAMECSPIGNVPPRAGNSAFGWFQLPV